MDRPVVAAARPQRSDSPAWLAADLLVKAATIALLLFALVNPDLPQFQGKAFVGRAVVYPLALALFPVGWWLFGRERSHFRPSPTFCSACRSSSTSPATP